MTRILPNERELPNSADAERAVVGAILLHEKSFLDVADILRASDFYSPILAAIFAAFVALDAASKPLDRLAVVEEMRSADTYKYLRDVEGEAFFPVLVAEVVTVENIAYYARIVVGKAEQRRAIEAAQMAHALAYQGEEDWHEAYGTVVFSALEARRQSTFTPLKTVLRSTVKAAEQRYDSKQAITGVPSGFHKLDALTAGFQASELVIIAGRPSMGKTSLVMNAIANAAVEERVPALVFSLEMSKEALTERLVCSEARIDSTRFRGGFLEQRDWLNLTKAVGVLNDAPIHLDDTGAPTLLEIRARARRWRALNQGKAILVVDYLQLIATKRQGRESNREREISEISRGLKALAKELGLPVVALSQLNRGVESRADKRPVLSDLRESGAIEQDADLILFVYRDEVYDKESQDKNVAEIIIGKQRNGATGTVKLAFLNSYTRFENLADSNSYPPPRTAAGSWTERE